MDKTQIAEELMSNLRGVASKLISAPQGQKNIFFSMHDHLSRFHPANFLDDALFGNLTEHQELTYFAALLKPWLVIRWSNVTPYLDRFCSITGMSMNSKTLHFISSNKLMNCSQKMR